MGVNARVKMGDEGSGSCRKRPGVRTKHGNRAILRTWAKDDAHFEVVGGNEEQDELLMVVAGEADPEHSHSKVSCD